MFPYCFTILLCYYVTILLFYYFTILLFYYFTILLFYYFTILLFYYFTILLSCFPTIYFHVSLLFKCFDTSKDWNLFSYFLESREALLRQLKLFLLFALACLCLQVVCLVL